MYFLKEFDSEGFVGADPFFTLVEAARAGNKIIEKWPSKFVEIEYVDFDSTGQLQNEIFDLRVINTVMKEELMA